MPQISVGMSLQANGHFTNHPSYGYQFKITEITQSGFAGRNGLIQYIAGEDFRNVGEVTATAIVDHFGGDVLQRLDDDPYCVMEVPGVPLSRLKQVANSWSESRSKHRELLALISMGLSPRAATAVINHFGEGLAEQAVKSNFYRLTEVRGFGFARADEIALKNGVPRNSPARATAAVAHALSEAEASGHCFLPVSELEAFALKLLGEEDMPRPMPSILQELKTTNRVVIEEGRVYSAGLYAAEVSLASRLHQIASYASGLKPYANTEELNADLAKAGLSDVTYAPKQLEAIMTAFCSRVCIITGGPGTGKTTVTKAICRLLATKGIELSLCAPTGRAAKRLTEATGRPAKTIHMLLGVQMDEFMHNAANPLQVDGVLVDESSMLDVRLAENLVEALEPSDRLIFIGDADQLPSVGAGNVLRDLIASKTIPTVRLDQIFRQEEGNTIIEVAHQVLHGEEPDLPTPSKRGNKNCVIVQAPTREKVHEYLELLLSRELPKVGYSSEIVQVLTPMRKRELGVNDLNPRLQALLNPPSESKRVLIDGDTTFREGDRVMQIKNNYKLGEEGVFNGDMGRVTRIHTANGQQLMEVTYPDMRKPVEYTSSEFAELQLAYASTIHKAQGSEYRAVILIMHPSHNVMLQRNLLYTGLTRAKDLCIIMGTSGAVASAVANNQEIRRNTTLRQRMISPAKEVDDAIKGLLAQVARPE